MATFMLQLNLSSVAQQKEEPIDRILFIFDASQSMLGRWQSGRKIDIAKKLLSNMVDSLKNIKNLEIGLRYEQVDQESTGTTRLPVATSWCLFADGNPEYDCNFFGMIKGEPEVFSEKGDGDYFLPNLNGSFEFAENQIFRFAFSKTNSRPDLEQMRATVDDRGISHN